MEVVAQGAEAVKRYMAKRWVDHLLEEERRSTLEANVHPQTAFLMRNASWLNNWVSGLAGAVAGYLAAETSKESNYNGISLSTGTTSYAMLLDTI
ncbi:Plant intracellular Ras-group-related LRR protein 3 [Nymphaea thermarum]|nr:Plant intracellular Ras-group-related LRR protein 3 [Nymphaea thermarum]